MAVRRARAELAAGRRDVQDRDRADELAGPDRRAGARCVQAIASTVRVGADMSPAAAWMLSSAARRRRVGDLDGQLVAHRETRSWTIVARPGMPARSAVSMFARSMPSSS